MHLELRRKRYTTRATFGELYVDGEFICYTLEDTLRPFGIKVYGETGLPAGDYKGRFRKSPTFKMILPILYTEDDLVSVKKSGVTFKYSLIHAGNYIEDTHSCILVGLEQKNNHIEKSKLALKKLLDAMDGVDDFTMTIKNERQEQ